MGATCGTPATQHFHALKANMPSMKGKTVAITGCTSGLGLVLARSLADLEAHVVMLNRPSARAEEAFKQVQAVSTKVTWIECDLMSFESVKAAAKEMKQRFSASGLHVLCNNAGISTFPDEPTVDGFDPQMQTNHLSHFLLTQQVWPLLLTASNLTGEARVVNHTSGARKMNKLPFDLTYYGKNSGQLGGDDESFMDAISMHPPGLERYAHSKLANLIFTYALDERLKSKGLPVKSLLAHPGLTATNLMSNSERLKGASDFMALFSHSEEDGAMGIFRCACEPDLRSGEFYGPPGSNFATGPAKLLPREDDLATKERQEQVWSASEQATGVAFLI